jgi:hypothetical protein
MTSHIQHQIRPKHHMTPPGKTIYSLTAEPSFRQVRTDEHHIADLKLDGVSPVFQPIDFTRFLTKQHQP